ncbi:hypothetical protein PZA11_002396 [Diplocarpon coronariae]
MALATMQRLVILSMIPILLLFLLSGLYINSREIGFNANNAGRVKEILHAGDGVPDSENLTSGERKASAVSLPKGKGTEKTDTEDDEYDVDDDDDDDDDGDDQFEGSEPNDPEPSEPSRLPEYAAGQEIPGKFLHVRPSPPVKKDAGFQGCTYPIVIHGASRCPEYHMIRDLEFRDRSLTIGPVSVTPDAHCTGALALYGSIVRNVLTQSSMLRKKTCVHITYVDPDLESIEQMYKWIPQKNPFKDIEDCAALDSTPALNDVVPIRFQSLPLIEKPKIMQAAHENWLKALNKIHSWAFDLYPRILLLDADSFIITDLALIFDETPDHYTIAAAPDQFNSCGDRNRVNGGMVLLRPSRYFQISALELVYDPEGSCSSGSWSQSEQELLNCICGGQGPARGMRPEFPCLIMPLYNSVWPMNLGCSAANVVPIRSMHMTVVTKPWDIEDKNLHMRFDYAFWGCVRDASRKGDLYALQECNVPPQEVTRLVSHESPPNKVRL